MRYDEINRTIHSPSAVFDTWHQAMGYALSMKTHWPRVHKQPFGTGWLVTLRRPFMLCTTTNGSPVVAATI